MKERDALREIMNRFDAQWPGLAPTVAYQLENEDFTEPDPSSGVSWVRVSVVHNAPVQDTIAAPGKRRIRRSGTIYVQLFSPLGSEAPIGAGGRDGGAAIGANVATIFQLASFGPSGDQLICGVTGVGEGGNEGRWYMVTHATPFRYYESNA